MTHINRNERSLSSEEEQATLTTLYDCSLDLKLKIPCGKMRENMGRIYRSVLITLAVEFVAKHEAYQGMTGCIYTILRKTLPAKRRNWRVASKTEWILNKNDKIAGHLVDTRPPKNATAIYDTIEHSGLVWNDNRNGPVTLDCNLKLFLSPGVLAAEDIYENHNFSVDTFKEDEWNNRHFLSFCNHALQLMKKDRSNFCGTWSCVIEDMEEYDDYWETKRRRYESMSEHSINEESNSEDN